MCPAVQRSRQLPSQSQQYIPQSVRIIRKAASATEGRCSDREQGKSDCGNNAGCNDRLDQCTDSGNDHRTLDQHGALGGGKSAGTCHDQNWRDVGNCNNFEQILPCSAIQILGVVHYNEIRTKKDKYKGCFICNMDILIMKKENMSLTA